MSTAALQTLNDAPEARAQAMLLGCCGSRRWARAVAAGRPYADAGALERAAGAAWQTLADADWLEAFAAHPRIGDVDHLRRRFASAGDRSNAEQGQVLCAPEPVLEALAAENRRYLARHGFIFIVCAAGLGAEEMLERLRARIGRTTAEELRAAAAEQRQITRLRLEEAFS